MIGVTLFNLRSATRSKWSPCRCESRTKSSAGRSSISTAGFVTRREVRPYPRCTWSPACKKLGSVRIVIPAYRITTVAVPTKKMEPRPKSGSSFLRGRVRDFRSGTGSTRRGRRLQLRHDLVGSREVGPAQGAYPLHKLVRRSVVFGGGGEVVLARRIIHVLEVLCRLVGADVHGILLGGR